MTLQHWAAALILALLPQLSTAHALSPGLIKVRAVDGTTQFRLSAINRFDRKASFTVTVYTDNTLTTPYETFRAVPSTLDLGPETNRRFVVRVTDIPEDITDLYVCTETTPDRVMNQTNTAVVTRVCSKITLRHMRRDP